MTLAQTSAAHPGRPQHPLFSCFRFLSRLRHQVAGQVALAGLPPLPRASTHRHCDQITAALAGPLAPELFMSLLEARGAIDSLAREALPLLLVGMHVSALDDVVEDLVMTTARGCGRWFDRWMLEGASPTAQWSGFLLGPSGRALRTAYLRRLGGVGGVRSDWGPDRRREFHCRGYESGCDLESQRRVRDAVAELPAVEQRCVRLVHGMSPVRTAWSARRISATLGMPPTCVERLVQRAHLRLRTLLADLA